MLSDQDSNLERQNQNLQCYRYTIGQKRCKPTLFRKNFKWCIRINLNYALKKYLDKLS